MRSDNLSIVSHEGASELSADLGKLASCLKTFHMQGGEADLPCSAVPLAKFPSLILLHQERQPFPNPHFKMMKFWLGNIKTNPSHFFRV